MGKRIQSVRGMNDILPVQSPYWQKIATACKQVAHRYAYQQIHLPIVELTELFKRSVGAATDIVEKEMYTFTDRNGDSLSLRPEGTAGCVRAGIEHSLFYNQAQRLWYFGPMFRHERPQKGRYRQFYQWGVEAFGLPGVFIEAEHILMMRDFWEMLGLADQIKLQLNNLGSPAARQAYRKLLIDFYQSHYDELDEDSQRRLTTNPLRILDSKNPAMQALNANAPILLEHLDAESKCHFQSLCQLLDHAGVNYEINPRIVRGLDYYNSTVYEWVTTALGAQGTVCAGGRYDELVTQLGGQPTAATGFALGIERLALLLEQREELIFTPDIYLIMVGEAATYFGLQVAQQLRQCSTLSLAVMTDAAGGSFKSQFKRADKSGARWALIIGDNEAQAKQIALKNLRQEMPQQNYNIEALIKFFTKEG